MTCEDNELTFFIRLSPLSRVLEMEYKKVPLKPRCSTAVP